MKNLIINVLVAIFIIGLLIYLLVDMKRTSLEEKEQQTKRVNTCFPFILDREIQIDGSSYVICHPEPGSKDYKIKELK